jgi:hypothetical protein
MAVVDRHGLPVAVHVASASPYEPHLVPATLDARFFADLPTRLIGDRSYDSDPLDDTLMTTYGIDDRRTPAWPCAHPRWPTASSRIDSAVRTESESRAAPAPAL